MSSESCKMHYEYIFFSFILFAFFLYIFVKRHLILLKLNKRVENKNHFYYFSIFKVVLLISVREKKKKS